MNISFAEAKKMVDQTVPHTSKSSAANKNQVFHTLKPPLQS